MSRMKQKLATRETERQKLKAKKEAEKRKAKSDKRLKEQGAKMASITEEAEEAKQKPLEMKIDCSKAGSKYKYLQKRKAEADGKYVTAERELGDLREEKAKNV